MAYQAKRSKTVKEEFQLIDENGKLTETLYVELSPSAVAEQLSKKYLHLQHSLQAVQSAKDTGENAYKIAGEAMKDITETIFGTDGTETIIEFYDGRLLEMCKEVLPFVGYIVPKIRKMAQEERKNIVSGYNRKTIRVFGKKCV